MCETNNSQIQSQIQQTLRPAVFDYTNYREYLKASFLFLKSGNTLFSESAFVQKAGFANNSRGYLALLVKGKRNLSLKSILGFSQALKHSAKEKKYFEALVLFNQSKSEQEKVFYFEKLKSQNSKTNSDSSKLLLSQFNYLTHWYIVAIRELIGLDYFREDHTWIAKKLRGRVKKNEIKSAITDLLNLGLAYRSENGFLLQKEERVKFIDDEINHLVVNQYHREILDLARMALDKDAYTDRSLSSVTMACAEHDFELIREEIRVFRQHILSKYATADKKLSTLLNLSVQLFHITPLEKKTRKK